MNLLVNNTEQVQPQDSNNTLIKLFCRSAENPEQRVTVTAHGFEPYLHVLEEDARDREDFLLQQDAVRRIDYGGYDAFGGETVARIYTQYPQDVPDVKEHFEQTWDADVPFTNRFRVDTGVRAEVEVPGSVPESGQIDVHWREINPVEPGSEGSDPGGDTSETTLQDVVPRVVTLDIEVDDRAEGFPAHGEERILSIVAHDNYTDSTKAFLDGEGRSPTEMFPDGAPDGVDAVEVLPGEKDMLAIFRDWFNEMDPDLVTGWNADDFDIPFILKRMDNLNVGANSLSPLGWSGVTSRGEPRIKGRTVYDLLTVYKKNQFTELRSYSLDHVAGEELDAEKIEFSGSFYDLYQDDPEKFIEYNANDVVLAVGINEEAGVIEFRDVLRREVGVDFEDSYDNKDFVDMMCRRKLKERGVAAPTRPDYGDEPDSDYEGAQVFSAYSGVAENVVGIDLASLYPYTMAMLNASPEMKVSGDFDGPAAEADNGQHFRLDEDGIFKELVDDAINLKSEYKQLREAADSEEEYEYWAVKYNTAKTITNSLYGVTGWERFFLYDEAVAEAVTLTGQSVIKRTAEYIQETGYEVLYGDTDSTYIKFPDEWTPEECINTAQELCQDLNDTVYPELAEEHGIPAEDNLWEIEVETHMIRYFQAGKKKRYAYVASWKDGRWLEEADVSITGFASKRSDSARLTVDTEEAVLDAILSGDEDQVSDIIFEAAQKVEATDPAWELIGIPGGMSKKISDDPGTADNDEYYAVSSDDAGNFFPQDAHPRAVYNANQILDVLLTSDSKPKRVYLKDHWFDEVGRQIDVIAFESGADMEPIAEEVTVDVPRMTNTLIENPLERICSAVGVDVGAAVRGQEQQRLGAF